MNTDDDPELSAAEAKLDADEFLAAEIERAMAPHRALLTPYAFRHFRAVLIEQYTENPVFVDMLKALRPRAPMLKSDELLVSGAHRGTDVKKPMGGSQ